jgi:TRAP-type C4-dicarboxylate transport system substrate-binding protein
MLAGVGSGVADLGVVVPAYEAGRLPLRTFHSLPFAFATPDQVMEVYSKADDILQPELDEFNVKSMYGTPAQFTITYTTDTPVKAVEDLKGLRIRTAGGLQEGIFLAVGAVPQTMSSTEIYTSMQRGMLDGVASLPTSAEAHDWSEFIKYMIFTNHSMVTGSTIMNMDTWNSLTPELQELMIEAGRDMQQHALAALDGQTQEAKTTSEAFGMDVSDMPQSERTKWKELTAPLWDEWLAAAEAAGKGDAARELLKVVEDVTK